MLLNMFIVMTSEQQEVGDVSEHVTTASFKYWTTLESVSMTTQSMAAVVWTELITRIFDPVHTDPESVWRESTSQCRSVFSLKLDLRISSWGLCCGPVLHLLVRFFTSGPAPGLRLLWSRTPESSGRCRSQTLSRPSAHRRGSEHERTGYCNSTGQVQFIQDEEPNIHRHTEAGEVRLGSPSGWCRTAAGLQQEPSAVCTAGPSPSGPAWTLHSRKHRSTQPDQNSTFCWPSLSFVLLTEHKHFLMSLPGSFFSIGFRSASSGNTKVISGEERFNFNLIWVKLIEIYYYIHLLLHLLNIQKRFFFQCL